MLQFRFADGTLGAASPPQPAYVLGQSDGEVCTSSTVLVFSLLRTLTLCMMGRNTVHDFYDLRTSSTELLGNAAEQLQRMKTLATYGHLLWLSSLIRLNVTNSV